MYRYRDRAGCLRFNLSYKVGPRPGAYLYGFKALSGLGLQCPYT
jgi:hypothetical protein